MPGVQTLLPLMLHHMNQGRISLERIVDLLCYGPQRIYSIVAKGRIALGYDADLTLVDIDQERDISDASMLSRCGWTPFSGMRTRGWPVMTLVGGHFAMRDGALSTEAKGRAVKFWDTSRR
jgi:dihydroorotase